MAIKEHATEQKVVLLKNDTVAAGTSYSEILDSADYDDGVYFGMALLSIDGTNNAHVFTIQEGDIANMSDAATVADAKLVYKTAISLDAELAEASNFVKEGCFSTKRYLRVKVVSTGIALVDQVVVLAIVNPELQPTAQN